MSGPTWHDGPPPESFSGLVLVVLDLTAPEHADHVPPGSPGWEYHGDPVAVRWWGKKGATTLGQARVNPEVVARYAACPEPPK